MKMLRKQERLCRLTATVLCLCMAVSMFAGLSAPRLARAETGSDATRQADPSTMDRYKEQLDFSSNTRVAGRIWSDKTVFALGDNINDNDGDWNGTTLKLEKADDGVGGSVSLDDDFLHVYSILGSTQNVNSENVYPLDVVLLLDISSSMEEGNTLASNALHQTIDRANELIDTLMNVSNDPSIHDDNRVGVVVYGGGAQVLMPLQHYRKQGGKILGIAGESLRGTHYFPSISAEAENFERKTTRYMYADSTYLQAALYQGMHLLATAEGTTTKDKNGKTISRQPVLIVLTDGATNIVGATSTGNYANPPAGLSTNTGHYYDSAFEPKPSNIQWWDPLAWADKKTLTENNPNFTVSNMDKNSLVVVPRARNRYASNEDYGAPNFNPIYLADVNKDSLESVAPRTMANLLTAGYMKNWIEAHYTENNKGTPVSLRGFSIGLNISHADGNTYAEDGLQWAQLFGTMDPRNYIIARSETTEGKGQLKKVYDGLLSYIDGNNVEFSYGPGVYTWLGTDLSAEWNFIHPTGKTDGDAAGNDAYDVKSLEDVFYIDKFYEATTGTIGQIFDQITEEITTTAFAPVGGTNDLGIDNALTYVDPMGKYMDVKDVKRLILFGTSYDIVKTAVYDYQWNHQYMVNANGGAETTVALTEGWYLNDPTDGSNDGVSGPERAAWPSGCSSAEDAWNKGWVYRLNYETASKFVPGLKEINTASDAVQQMRQTTYTFYRIDGITGGDRLSSTQRNDLKMNPAYGTTVPNGVTYNEDTQDHLNTPGVYALSDLRIWVEDSGDYAVSHPGTLTDASYDEALWINIPANMLPLRKITIDERADNTATYETNIPSNTDFEAGSAESASFPLRVIYTVGVSDDVRDQDTGRINVGALEPEYIRQNKMTTAAAAAARGIPQSSVEFFSNWYNPINRYGDYVTTTTEYTFGDPVTSFSPSGENRYYAFEKALPLYKNAYIWVESDQKWKKVSISTEGSGAATDDVTSFTATKFGGVVIAEGLEPEALQQSDSAEAIQQKLWTALNNVGYYQTEAEASNQHGTAVKDGQIALLKAQQLTDVTYDSKNDPFPSNGYFFFAIEYYELTPESLTASTGSAEKVQYAITRKGSEFGSAYQAAGITNGDMLVWHDVSGKHTTDYPYLSYSETDDKSRGRDYIGTELDDTGYYAGYDRSKHAHPDTPSNTQGSSYGGGEWVVSAKPGGLRVGNLAQNVQNKGGDYSDEAEVKAITDYYLDDRYAGDAAVAAKNLTWGFYGNNVTRTANNFYLPTISTNSNAAAEDVIVNVYHGNNGRLYVPETTLLVTKQIDNEGGPIDRSADFNFQLYIAGMERGTTVSAVVVQWNETAKAWQRQFHYIDMSLDAQRFLLTQDGSKAIVDGNGNRVVLRDDGTYHYTNERADAVPTGTTLYYVYLAPNSNAGDIGVSDNCFRVYHNDEVDSSETVSTADVTYDGSRGQKSTFKATKVYLIPQTEYDNEWAGNTGVTPESDAKFLTNFTLLTIDPSPADAVDTTEIAVTTDYLTASTYYTKDVTFGVNANDDSTAEPAHESRPGTELTASDLYDQVIPTGDRPDYFNGLSNGTIAESTAEFTLKHGQALLFNSIPSGTVYRITEQLTEAQIGAGYVLKEVTHTQQVGSSSTYRPGKQSIPVYYKNDGKVTYNDWYSGTDFPAQYSGNPVEKGLLWAKSDNELQKSDYLHNEPFHHTNAVVWDAYSTMERGAAGDNHHQPRDVDAGTSTVWIWNAGLNTSENTGLRHTVADNPSCEDLRDGGCDETLENGQVRHYFFYEGKLVDAHYKGEGSGFLRNIGRYITSPTVHFGVKEEKSDQNYATKAMPDFTQSTNYTHAYSVFGNTGSFEESANFVNTINNDKTETEINGNPVQPSEQDKDLFPGVQVGDEITYQIKWANTTSRPAHVLVIDPLDKGVAYESASGTAGSYEGGYSAGYFYAEDKAKANAIFEAIYNKYHPTYPAEEKITKDYAPVVIWDLGEKEAGDSGFVYLTVKVNEDAKQYWNYDGHGVPSTDTGDDDYLVRDQATVHVGNTAYTTAIVRNPVGYPDKTETHIERGDTGTAEGAENTEVTEGEDGNLLPKQPDATGEAGNLYEGPLVYPGNNTDKKSGDKITYKISWRNYQNVPALITITDPLDNNVRLVRASFSRDDVFDEKLEKLDTFDANAAQNASIGDLKPADGSLYPASTQTDGITVNIAEEGSPAKNVPVIAYNAPQHDVPGRPAGTIVNGEVVWNLGVMPAGSSGTVEFTVEVLESATQAGYVENTAYVAVGNDAAQQTRTIENPTPSEGKTETSPGAGELVGVGQQVDYKIHWRNDLAASANVIVMDTLDPGVTFKTAAVGDAKPMTPTTPTEPQPGEMATDLDDGVIKASDFGYAVDNSKTPATHPLIVYYDKAGTYKYNLVTPDPTKPDPQEINVPSHTVVWDLGPQEARYEGDVTLSVTVNEKAKVEYKYDEENYKSSDFKENTEEDGSVFSPNPYDETQDDATDYLIHNQARTMLEHYPYHLTEIVDNPVTEKTEVTPGEDELVGIGKEITYQINWRTGSDESDYYVVVMDTLDPGLDYVSATASYTYVDAAGEKVTVNLPSKEVEYYQAQYYEVEDTLSYRVNDVPVLDTIPARTVVWQINSVPANAVGTVTLKVKVNENAKKNYTYNENADGTVEGDGLDYKVLDQARVQYDHTGFVKTNPVENPVPAKTETDENGKPSPGDGKLVEVDDEITYTIHWENTKDAAADIEILDPLDEGVEFVSASFIAYDGNTEPATQKLLTLNAGEKNDDVAKEFKDTEAYSPDYTPKFSSDVIPNIRYTKDGMTREDVVAEDTFETLPKHSVLWKFKAEANQSGDVLLKVRVTEKALDKWNYKQDGYDGTADTTGAQDYEVFNRAVVSVDNNPQVTVTVENPLPGKTEVSGKVGDVTYPAEGDQVYVGKQIRYSIHWWNDQETASTVYITDPLDDGVDFVSASFKTKDKNGELVFATDGTSSGEDEYGDVDIKYDETERSVLWTLSRRPAANAEGSSGEVELIVEVNDKAVKTWEYGINPDTGEPDDSLNDPHYDPSKDEDPGNDYEVRNRAKVQIGDLSNDAYYTNVPENPLPAKTETDEKGEPSPGDGKIVNVGEVITYSIAWNNTDDQPADIEILDPLDAGVEFVSASFIAYDGSTTSATQKLLTLSAEEMTDGAAKEFTGDEAYSSNFTPKFSSDVTPSILYTSVEKERTDAAEVTFKTLPARSVLWKFKAEAHQSGVVQLKVKVTEKAFDKWDYKDGEYGGAAGEAGTDGTLPQDFEVVNRAVVSVGNNPQVTNKVENPLEGKTEVPGTVGDVTYPAEGEIVEVGEQIRYRVYWRNDASTDSDVYITDPLDKGVDFVSASFGDAGIGGVLDYEENIKDSPDKVVTITGTGSETATISYYKEDTVLFGSNNEPLIGANEKPVEVPARSVMWKLPKRPANSGGYVELVVKVNENAVKTWEYGVDKDGKPTDTPIDSNTTNDYEVRNRAKVQVGSVTNEPRYTNVPENPLPGKTETDENGEPSPGDGVLVGVGDEITYTIHWENVKDAAADIEILDPLDEGVEFVSASFIAYNGSPSPTTQKLLTLNAGEKNDDGTVKDGELSITDYSDQYTPKFSTAAPDGYAPSIRYTSTALTRNDAATDNKLKDMPARSVLWKFKAEANQSGDVLLKVNVTEKALDGWKYDTKGGYGGNTESGEDFEVFNRAVVSVDNEPKITNTVENPLPKKTEENAKGEPSPGDGKGVKVGDEVTYRIDWKNGPNDAAKVIITDQLDNGVDFVSASFKGEGTVTDSAGNVLKDNTLTLTSGAKSIEYDGIMLVDDAKYVTGKDEHGTIQIEFTDKVINTEDPNKSTPAKVTWTLGTRPAGSEGYVELVVRVNKDAVHTWEYGATTGTAPDGTTPDPDTPERNDGDFDYKIVNRAKVQIGNHSAYTNIPENPLPEKTEVTPGEGEFVDVGKDITYQIAWKNTTGQEADIVIVDPLDDGVDFVAAAFGAPTKNADETETWPFARIGEPSKFPNGDPDEEIITEKVDETSFTLSPSDGNLAEQTVTIEYTTEGKNNVTKGNPSIDAPKRSVIWKFKAAKDGEGIVTLKVRVNDQATVKWAYDSGNIGGSGPNDGSKDYEVVDRAVVDVNNTPSFTNDVHNPVPEKEEVAPEDTDPKEGDLVGVGDTVTYEIGWNNGENSEATVTITDPLDIGVTFKSASFGGVTLEKGQTSASSTDGKITIAYAYDEETHTETITWTLEDRPAHDSGKVTLAVTVNENAAKGWAYGPVPEKDSAGEGTVGGSETGKSDQEIVNRARVQFGNSFGYTAEVKNPVPEKTEETPGDGTMVSVGDKITYRVYWHNNYDEPAKIIVTDPLDDGADFVSASYGGVTLSMPELSEGQTEPSGEITASDDEGNPTITITYNPAAQTANGTTQRLVTWEFEANENAADYVELTIRVNENAVKKWTYSPTENEGAGSTNETDKDYEVINRAHVQIGNRSGFTATVENPIPEKEETSPGEGKAVDVGSPIKYAIHWKNGHDEAADVIIRDTLDMGHKGVDFVSAEFVTTDQNGVAMTVKNGETTTDLYGEVSIAYDAASDTVKWTLKNRPAKAKGEVILNVQVNENAREPGKVENQAGVTVGDDNEVLTRIIPNPLGPSKTETHINDEPVELEPIPSVPGAPSTSGGFRGPQVNENDTVTYKVHWVNNAADENGKLIDADVKVIDPLDKGVYFVAASLSPEFEADKTLTADGESLSVSGTDELGGWSIAYDADARAVTWKLGNRAAGTGGDVYLTVRVNRQASYFWQYGEGDTPPKVDDNAKDNEIVNRARVIVWNETENKSYTDVYTDVIHNPLVSGDLTVTKMVTFGGEEDREFAFRVELDNPKINGTYGDMTFKDGVAEFTLHHGQTKTAKDLPGGTGYKVTELLDDPVRYIMSATGDVGTIGETAAVAAFENHYVPPEVPKTGDDADKWFLLMLISAAGIALTALTSRRRPGDGNAK